MTNLECSLQEVTTHKEEGRKRSGRVERLQLIERRLCAEMRGCAERRTPWELSALQHKQRRSSSLSLSLSKRSVEVGMVRSLIRGSGWGWEAGGGWRWGGAYLGEIWEIPDGSCAKEAGLKAAAGTLSLQFPLPPTDRSERLCKFLRSLRRLGGRQCDDTLCIGSVCAPWRTEQRGFYKARGGGAVWGTKANTSRACCKLCLDDPSRQQVWLPSETEVTAIEFPILAIYSVCWQFCILKHFPT